MREGARGTAADCLGSECREWDSVAARYSTLHVLSFYVISVISCVGLNRWSLVTPALLVHLLSIYLICTSFPLAAWSVPTRYMGEVRRLPLPSDAVDELFAGLKQVEAAVQRPVPMFR